MSGEQPNTNIPTGDANPHGTFSWEILSFHPTPLQEQILAIAKEMLDKHYVLKSNALFSQCQRYLKVETRQLVSAFNELISKRILVDGKAITKERVFDTGGRKDIFDDILKYPGINVPPLAKLTNLGFTTVRWHVKILEQFQMIRTVPFDNQFVFFDIYLDPVHDARHYLLNKKHVVDIVKVIVEAPRISFAALQERVAIPRTTLIRKMKALIVGNIVHRHTDGDDDSALFSISPDIKD
nr:hypothetical protein [Candidatus Sigynarchaeota archaeon]